ncbi:MAG TPA: hypothetical protein VFT52_00660 [Luteimonas sp.]|jgi:hypothetical protein|nr:hypothetical protein [Luteimonas sp.]
MAKPNYGFEKRQRELAKKKKQEEKTARKRESRAVDAAAPSQDAGTEAPATAERAPAGSSGPATQAVPAPRIHRRAPGRPAGD